jgi:hypothetical protein
MKSMEWAQLVAMSFVRPTACHSGEQLADAGGVRVVGKVIPMMTAPFVSAVLLRMYWLIDGRCVAPSSKQGNHGNLLRN